jgi:nitrate/nitrite transporter NarK
VGLWFGRITVFWITVSEAVPNGSSGAAMGVANSVGNLGAFVGPLVFGWLRTSSGGFSSSMIVGGVALMVAGLMALAVGSNRRPKAAVVEAMPVAVRH